MSLEQILVEAVEGKRPWSDVTDKIVSLVKPVAVKAETALETFGKQFLSDFGAQALSLAASFVSDLINGTSMQEAAAKLAPQITADAITDAEKDGTVVLNALRVQLTAASPAITNVTPATVA